MKTSIRVATLLALAFAAASGCALPARATLAPDGAASASAARQSWLEGAVVYGVVPPLFGEKPLQAVTSKLDYLKEQGVDAIWLSPVNATDDPSAISYAVTDYKAVRPDFGTTADFKRLVAESHRRGMRVLMDFVPNHTSTGHPWYADAEKRGKQSPYWHHYVRDARGNAQHYFDWENLKNLDYGQSAVQDAMTDAFTYWVRDMGVDGFRVDAAWGVKDRTPAYWPRLSAQLRALRPDVWLLAEASARDPYYVKNGFDAAYDWGAELGHWAWEGVFERPAQAGDALRKVLSARETPPEQIARFLNNNDTAERFITRHGVATQRVAAVLMHTLPGIPVVYTGDEVGAEFEPYEDPPPIAWTDRHKLKPLYRQLASLRESLPALRKGHWTQVATKRPGVYAFTRDAGSGGWALVVLNFGAATDAELAVPAPVAAAAGRLSDALSGKAVNAQAAAGSLRVSLKASEALILTPGK